MDVIAFSPSPHNTRSQLTADSSQELQPKDVRFDRKEKRGKKLEALEGNRPAHELGSCQIAAGVPMSLTPEILSSSSPPTL